MKFVVLITMVFFCIAVSPASGGTANLKSSSSENLTITSGGKSFGIEALYQIYDDYFTARRVYDRRGHLVFNHDRRGYLAFKDDAGDKYFMAFDRESKRFVVEKINIAAIKASDKIVDDLNPGIRHREHFEAVSELHPVLSLYKSLHPGFGLIEFYRHFESDTDVPNLHELK